MIRVSGLISVMTVILVSEIIKIRVVQRKKKQLTIDTLYKIIVASYQTAERNNDSDYSHLIQLNNAFTSMQER